MAKEINNHLLEKNPANTHSARRTGDIKCQTGPERATFTPNVPELCSVFLFMISRMVEICNGSHLPLSGAWSKSTTEQLGFERLRLEARFSARVLGGGSPSQILVQAAAIPQNDGSSECEDPSELPSDGESLNMGRSNLLARGVGFVVTGTPLHITPPLHSSGVAWKEGLRVSTFSMGLILRRLLCVRNGETDHLLTAVYQLQQLFKTNISCCTAINFPSHTFLFAGQRLSVSSACSISGPVRQRMRLIFTNMHMRKNLEIDHYHHPD